jgi:hypothetical protein
MARRLNFVKLAAAASAMLAAAPAAAQTSGTNQPVFTWTRGDFSLTGNLIASLSNINSISTGFGTGSWLTDGTHYSKNVAALEAFAKPQLVGLYDPGPYNIYGRLSAGIGLTTFQGDAYFPYDTSYNNPFRIQLEEAVVGIRSGTSFRDWGISDNPDIFDFSVGNQDFYVGDGFLIDQGASNGGRRAAYWSGQRTAFSNTAIVRVNTQPVRADFFNLGTNYSQRDAYWPYVGTYPQTQLVGANLEYYGDSVHDGVLTKDWTYGFAFMHAYNSDVGETYAAANAGAPDVGVVPGAATGATRSGMNILDIRAQGQLIHSLPNLFLSGEFVYENNPSSGLTDNGYVRQLNAQAYYAEAAWQFDGGWKPKVGVRLAHFSGQKPNATSSTAFDPLFYGYSYAPSRNVFGTWIMGEIVGEYYMFNTNENVGMLYATAAPTSEITLSAFLYDFAFDQYPAPGMTSKNAFQELDLEADYYPTAHPWLGFTALAGLAYAGEGGRQYINSVVAGTAANPDDIKPAGTLQGLVLLTMQMTF